jgi:hypothetical protein
MTKVAAPPKPILADETRLARLHLRLGMLVLARAELEDLERRHLLDAAGRGALAEARWRSGDFEEAATAARAHLEAGGQDPVAICVAVEAAAADGRPTEARELMERLGPPDATTLDALFAGMPRRASWPALAGEQTEPATLFGEATTTVRPAVGHGARVEARGEPVGGAPSPTKGAPAPLRSVPGPREVLDATDPTFWPEAGAASGRATTTASPSMAASTGTIPAPLAIDAAAELERARDEIAHDPARGFLRLALVLRADATLAPTVLEIVADRMDSAAALIRGDAERLLGRHLEAEAAFATAAAELDSDRPSTQ